MSNYKSDKDNPFTQKTSLQRTDEAIYGGVTAPSSGRKVAKPLPIADIWPDVTQPRRVIPASIRRAWDGNPAYLPTLLWRWQELVGDMLNIEQIIRGEAALDLDIDQQPGLVQGLMEIVDLAINIRDNGLNTAITVAEKPGGGYLLHTGERRLMAHHLLNMVLGTHDKIAAEVREHDVWSQIAENTQRKQMNAVSMARSLAKLLMDMYSGEVAFRSPVEMITEDGSDRAYFAQAVDLKIKYGMAEQVQNALSIANKSMVSRYNKILTLPDDVWVRADEENWTEGRIRQWFDSQKAAAPGPEAVERLPIGNHLQPAAPQPSQPAAREISVPSAPLRSEPRDEGMPVSPSPTAARTTSPKSTVGEGAPEAHRLADAPDNPLINQDVQMAVLARALQQLALAVGDTELHREMTATLMHSQATIAEWLEANGGSTELWEAQLKADGERIAEMLTTANQRLWSFLERLLLAGETIAGK
ncbi:MAG: hypothetical protein OHK0046_46250 [Anaerolineae bacterium]